MNIALWIVQALLALVFLGQAIIKFVLPDGLPAQMEWVYDIPRLPNIAIGVLELLAVIGLILPGITGIMPRLASLAAIGLMLTMVGAVIFHVMRGEIENIPVNVALFVLAGFVAWGRARRPAAAPVG